MIDTGTTNTGTTGLLREARLSHAALECNIAALLADSPAAELVVDVRADAYGHGLVTLVGVLAEHGVRRFRVSPGIILASGLDAETGAGDPDLELAVYGFTSALGPASTRPAPLRPAPTRPVLSLVGEVVAVKRVPAGSAVSYGYTYRTEQDSTIALVGLGYADGLPRLGSNTAHATISGEPAIVAGRIAMDQFVLDLGEGSATLGDEVTLWGDPDSGEPSLHDWAAIARRAPQQVTAGLGWRVSRTWVDGVSS